MVQLFATVLGILVASETAGALSQEDQKIIDIIKDARVANESHLRAGTMSVDLWYVDHAGAKPVELKADITWDEKNTLWAYRIRDPDNVAHIPKSSNPDLPVADQPVRYMLRSPKGLYAYNPSTNTLYLQKSERMYLMLFELAPLVHWTLCHSQRPMSGRPWAEMIGPHPAFPMSTYTVTREGPDLVRQVRRDATGGTFTVLMSLGACGNVLEASYTGVGRTWQTFTWGKTPAGVCVLKECEFKRSVDGHPDQIDSVYRLKVSNITLSQSISPEVFSERAFFSKFRRGFTFVDEMTRRSSRNGNVRVVTDQELKKLAEDLRSSGFLKP